MKNLQYVRQAQYKKGFVVPLLIAIIALLVIGGGVYIYENKKVETPVVTNTGIQQSDQIQQQTNAQTPPITSQQNVSYNSFPNSTTPTGIAVTGMQQYTDYSLGFSFWYPSSWQVTKTIPDQKSDQNISAGNVISTLVIGEKDSSGNTKPEISIQEVQAPSYIISDTFGTDVNPIYFFNLSTHTWMTVKQGYNTPAATTTADVSENTMGGLHMLGGTSQYGTATIIPLSAHNFVVVNTIGSFKGRHLAQTVTATDPTVAVPINQFAQTQIIQAEQVAYAVQTSPIVWKTYTDSQLGFSFQYPTAFNGAADLQNGSPQVFVTSTSTNIDTNGCYNEMGANGYKGGSQVIINNIPFCLSTGGDVGAGQSYSSFAYTTHRNGEYITLEYTVHTSNGCGVFEGDPSYLFCEYSGNNYDSIVTQPIQKSVGTLTFTN